MKALKNQLRIKLIETPNLSIADSNIKLPTQDFSATKSSVNSQRNKIGRLATVSGISRTDIAAQLGIATPILKKYIESGTIKTKDAKQIAKQIVNVIDSNDIPPKPKKAKVTTEVNSLGFKGDEKGKIRDLYFAYLNKTKTRRTGKFFSLPSKEWYFETQLNTEIDNNFEFVVCECESDIFPIMLANMVTKNIKIKSAARCLSSEIILNTKNDYFSHIFADWCGTFATLENEVRHMISNDIVKVNGLIGLTFSTREANTKNQCCIDFNKEQIEKYDMKDDNGNSVIPTVIGGIEMKIDAIVGKNYVVKELKSYYDTQSMVFVLIERIK